MVKNLLVSQNDCSYYHKNHGLFIRLAVALDIFMSDQITVQYGIPQTKKSNNGVLWKLFKKVQD